MAPLGQVSDPVEDARKVVHELEKFSAELAERPRWLVLNKMDLLDSEQRQGCRDDILHRLGWDGPAFMVSALTGEGARTLCARAMEFLEATPKQLTPIAVEISADESD